MPTMYVIAGPNGAGKTTAAYYLLPEVFETVEFVNADEIAKLKQYLTLIHLIKLPANEFY